MNRYLRAPVTHRRFHDGYMEEISGLPFRVRQGRKHENDLVLEWHTGDSWRAIDMRAGFLLADFFYENEHVLYPPPAQGGEKYRRAMERAIQRGYDEATAELLKEKRAKREREAS